MRDLLINTMLKQLFMDSAFSAPSEKENYYKERKGRRPASQRSFLQCCHSLLLPIPQTQDYQVDQILTDVALHWVI